MGCGGGVGARKTRFVSNDSLRRATYPWLPDFTCSRDIRASASEGGIVSLRVCERVSEGRERGRGGCFGERRLVARSAGPCSQWQVGGSGHPRVYWLLYALSLYLETRRLLSLSPSRLSLSLSLPPQSGGDDDGRGKLEHRRSSQFLPAGIVSRAGLRVGSWGDRWAAALRGVI